MGSGAVHGKMFLVSIFPQNLGTFKAANGQSVERKDYERTKF